MARVTGVAEDKIYEVEGKTCDSVYKSSPPPVVEYLLPGKGCPYEAWKGKKVNVNRSSTGEIISINGPGVNNILLKKVDKFTKE